MKLNENTPIDQTLNSKAFSYDDTGSLTMETNLLGVADNRVLNCNFEQLNGSQPINWYSYSPAGTMGGCVNDYVSSPVTGSTGWTKYALPFTPPANNATMKIRAEAAGASGTAWFDNIRLSYGKLAANNTYDGNKNYVINSTNQLQNSISYQNDAYGQITQIKLPDGEVTKYSYDKEERLKSVIDNAGSVASYNLGCNKRWYQPIYFQLQL